MPGNATIRDEVAADVDAIRAVHLAAFGDHGRVVNDVVDRLHGSIAPDHRIGLVAVGDDEVIGHAMFTRSLLDAPPRLVEVMVLSPVGVVPDWQRQGVGTALIRAGIDRVTAMGEPLVFLEGDPGYYSRLGFRAAGELRFRRPSLRIPEPAFQVMTLPSYEPWMGGTLVYAQAFWDADAVGRRDEDVGSHVT